MPSRNSLAFVLAFELPGSIVVGAFLYTFLDPIMQNLFGSAFYSSSTKWGQDALRWHSDAWTYMTVVFLLMMLLHVWVHSRQGVS